ncbi:MAG: carbohydrate kinase family protein [Bauldia sp.]
MSDIADGFRSVTVFGGVTIDRMAVTASPPVMGASNPGVIRLSPGGVGFNVASVLSRLGVRVRLVARVGDDAEGRTVIDAAKAAGIDTAGIAVAPGERTAVYQGAFDDNGGLIVGISDMAVYDGLTPEFAAAVTTVSPAADFWLVDANLAADTLAFLAEAASADHRPLAALAVSPAKAGRLHHVLSRLTYLFANRKEAEVIAATAIDGRPRTPVALAGELVGHGAANATVTDGANPLGAAASGAEPRSFAPLRAAVRSVNGAGDSLAAGTIYGLSLGRPFYDAVRVGLAAAVMTLEAGSVGDAPFTPTSLAGRTGSGSERPPR